MPVNTAALKTFAPAMRRQLLEAVGRKLDLLLHSQTPDTLSTHSNHIAELRAQEAEERDQLLERVAYTWFNRFSALRYLDARNWHPFGCRILTASTGTETQPEILQLARMGSIPQEIREFCSADKVSGLLLGTLAASNYGFSPEEEAYGILVSACCKFYSKAFPELFGQSSSHVEVLMPIGLLSEGSVAGLFRTQIDNSDCETVEILGWLYQYYAQERKESAATRNKAIKESDLGVLTQLFTPEWIVRYIVDNTLGKRLVETCPESELSSELDYLILGPDTDIHAEIVSKDSIEDIRVIDPAAGSAHMLTYAFDLLAKRYDELGYSKAEAARLILEKNLVGLDICPRATQIARLSLALKARELDRKALNPDNPVNPKIHLLRPSLIPSHTAVSWLKSKSASETIAFIAGSAIESTKHLDVVGALLVVEHSLDDLSQALDELEALGDGTNLDDSLILSEVRQALQLSIILSSRYEIVITNPPYLGIKSMPNTLKSYVTDNYGEAKVDMFSCFIMQCGNLCMPDGYSGMMTPFVWMFLQSYEGVRSTLIKNTPVTSLVQLEYSGFDGATVPICAFTFASRLYKGENSCFIRLSDFKGSANQAPRTLEAIKDQQSSWFYRTRLSSLLKVPSLNFAYWLSQEALDAFSAFPQLGNKLEFKQGIATSDNSRFLRLWHEVNISKIEFDCSSPAELANSSKKWFPYNKGGELRRWYGNNDYVVNWENDGKEMKDFTATLPQGTWVRLKSREYYCLPCVTYSSVSSGQLGARLSSRGFLFDTAGSCLFGPSDSLLYFCALLNSTVGRLFLEALCPTLSFTLAGVKAVPAAPVSKDILDYIERSRAISKLDWDSREGSWEYRFNGAIELRQQSLSTALHEYEHTVSNEHEELAQLERQINEHFATVYRLSSSSEFAKLSSRHEVSLPAFDLTREVEQVLSYMVGCIMGRYSIYRHGLILADSRESQENHLADYELKVGKSLSSLPFKPDPDGIIPVLDGEWFEDDIVAHTREFLEVTFPESSVTENLRFIEESLGKDIRKYFCTEFYKDHLQTYKKRPIYWMVQSPKKGFACLIYLHRYTKDTLNQVLNNYFRPYLQKLEARLAQLGLDQLNDDLPTRERTAARKEAEKITKVLKECQAWEQDALLPLAQQRIELDLDDGVKVNYLKLQDVLAPIPGLAAKED
jgi:hypothetical protein